MTEEQQEIHDTLIRKLFENGKVPAADSGRFESYWPLAEHDDRSQTTAIIRYPNSDFAYVCCLKEISIGLNS